MSEEITKEMEERFIKDAEDALNAELKDIQIRVSAMIDLDILLELERQSEEIGIDHRVYLNNILRSYVLGER